MTEEIETCLDEVGRYQDAYRRLKDLGIKPERAGKMVRELAKAGKLTHDVLVAYFNFRRRKDEVGYCLWRLLRE